MEMKMYKYFEYDDLGRITKAFLAPPGIKIASYPDDPLDEGEVNFIPQTNILLENTYETNHTWLQQSKEGILHPDGTVSGFKTTDMVNIDDIGRPEKIIQTYPDGTVSTTPTYTDAGLISAENTSVAGPSTVSLDYTFDFDNVLRPTDTRLNINGSGLTTLSSLYYTPFDQVQSKLLGQSNGKFLQKVDYLYDAAGKLLYINTPAEMECFQDDAFCDLVATLSTVGRGQNCYYVYGVEIEGQYYPFSSPVSLLAVQGNIDAEIEEAIDHFGYVGDVSHVAMPFNDPSGNPAIEVTITISNANFDEIRINTGDCGWVDFTL